METDFIDDFIEEYKKQPCLWQASSADFKNRKKRQEAYHKLIEVANKHGEHYNIERTKQKINNLRCAFRHQLRKFTESKNKAGSGKEDTYCPKRRYFESLMFLLDEERPETASKQDRKTNISEKPAVVAKQTAATEYTIAEPEDMKEVTQTEIVIQQQPSQIVSQSAKEEIVFETTATAKQNESRVHFEVQSNEEVNFLWSPRINRISKPVENNIIHMAASEIVEQEQHQQIHHHQPQQSQSQQQQQRPASVCSRSSSPSSHSENAPKKVKIDCSTSDFQKLLSLACSKMNSPEPNEDSFAVFGKMVAYKLRSMDTQQSIIAEKMITDVLLDGQMKMLSYPTRTSTTTTTIPYRQDTGHAFVISGLNINGTAETGTDRNQQYSTQTIQYSTGNGSQI